MTDTVEKVARALCRADMLSGGWESAPNLERLVDKQYPVYEAQARAALAAMAGDASAGAGIADVAEMMRLGRAAMAGEAEPVAWRFEIADAVVHNDDGTKTGAKWRVVLSPIEPCVPEWGIRNLTPLYAPAEG